MERGGASRKGSPREAQTSGQDVWVDIEAGLTECTLAEGFKPRFSPQYKTKKGIPWRSSG